MRSIATFFATLVLGFAQAAAAQEIPSRVGRLAFTEGPVSVYQDPELGWDKAYMNTPITSENSVWTDRGARAEMRVGGIAARLDAETQLDVSRLDENDFDAGIPRGAVNLRVRYKERNDHITLNTPHALFAIETDGRYRLDVDEERDQSRFTVLGGYAFMESSSGRIPVEPGRMVIVSGGGQYAFERAREDGFDKWASARDQQWQDSTARRYVPYDMTGYEELDRYGQWSQDADYGAVWYPRVSSGWAPYRYGHWAYVRPWGYTWIDDQPWGYAPSHYGRWVEVNNRWGWVPGYTPSQPVTWAPALVGFFGGAGFSVGVSSGAPVGWYPLAPWERYDPWYRASPTYVTRVNRYVVDRRPRWYSGRGDDWRHLNRDRAYTVVNRDVFVSRRAVQTSVVRVSPEQVRQAQVSNAQVVQQMLPQRTEVVRWRESNRTNVAAPVVSPAARRNASVQQGAPVNPAQGEAGRIIQVQPQQQPQTQQQAQQQGAVVRPDFRRRSAPAVVAPAPAGAQPAVSAPAPQQAQPQRGEAQQPQNPMARRERPEQQQLQQQQQQQQQEQARRQQEQAQRDQQMRVQQEQQRQQEAQRAAQEQQRAQQAQQQQQQQQERAARDQQRQQQQAAEAQRKRDEAAQRAQQDQQQRAQQEQRRQQEAQRAQQDQQQRAQQEQRRQQEAQRAAQEQQRAQQAQQQQQQQQAREAARQQQQQQQQQQQPKEQPPQAANPNARGENPGQARARQEKEKKDKDDKEKEKDKR